MKAVAVIEPGRVEIVELPEPDVGPYEVLVRTEASFICNATDRKVIDGHFPNMGPDSYPLILGHESVGRVVRTGPKVRTFRTGDRTIGGLLLNPPGKEYKTGWGGHSQYILITDDQAMKEDGLADSEHGWDDSLQIMKKVPEDISIEAAGLLCTWREVYAGMFTDFHLKEGQDIAIFGAGPVGLSFIKFARLSGLNRIISIDPLENKRARALDMGADLALAPDSAELKELIKNQKFDAVIDAVGHENIINAALPMVKMAGSICVYGVVGSPEIRLKKDTGPYNFNLYIHQWPTRHAEAAAQEPLIEWIRKGLLKAEDFVTGIYPIDDFTTAVEAVRKPDSIKTMLTFESWGSE